MRDLAAWIRGMRASSGAPIRAIDDERAAATLFVGSTTEPGPAAALLATEPGAPRSPFVKNGVVNRGGSSLRPQSGWDPYEVWSTRLKRPYVGTQERESLPADEARTAGPAVAYDP